MPGRKYGFIYHNFEIRPLRLQDTFSPDLLTKFIMCDEVLHLTFNQLGSVYKHIVTLICTVLHCFILNWVND